MENWQWIINIALGLISGAIGWFARQIWDDLKLLKKELADFRVEVARDYTPRNDFKDAMAELRNMFEIIRDKLDNKADK